MRHNHSFLLLLLLLLLIKFSCGARFCPASDSHTSLTTPPPVGEQPDSALPLCFQPSLRWEGGGFTLTTAVLYTMYIHYVCVLPWY